MSSNADTTDVADPVWYGGLSDASPSRGAERAAPMMLNLVPPAARVEARFPDGVLALELPDGGGLQRLARAGLQRALSYRASAPEAITVVRLVEFDVAKPVVDGFGPADGAVFIDTLEIAGSVSKVLHPSGGSAAMGRGRWKAWSVPMRRDGTCAIDLVLGEPVERSAEQPGGRSAA